MHNNQADLIFLIETTGFIGVCFDQIKEKYLNPILESLWGYSLKDEIGVINDTNGLLISAIGYKSLDSLPSSICRQIEPTSNAKLFYEKFENMFNFNCGIGDDQTHIAEGLAFSLEVFKDFEMRRKQKVNVARHLILIASQYAYEDVPCIESNTYRGYKFNDMLEELKQHDIQLSIISPKYSTDFLKLYEKVNGRCAEYKIDCINNSCFLLMMHFNININVQQNNQMQRNSSSNQIAPIPTPPPSQQTNIQQQISIEDIYLSSNDSPGLNTTQMVSSPSNQIPQQQFNNQQQQYPKHLYQNTQSYNNNLSQTSNFNDSFGHLSSNSQQPPTINNSQNIRFPQNQQKNIHNQTPSSSSSSLRPIQPANQPQQQNYQGVIQQHQQQSPLPNQQQQQHLFNNNQIQQQPRPNYLPPQQQQQQQSNQPQPVVIWSGILEWHEKVPSSPSKVTKSCVVKAVSTDINFTRALGEKWPDKLLLSLLSNQIFTLLVPQIDNTSKRIIFVTEGSNQDLKNVLLNQNLYKGGFINFPNNIEPKVIIVTCQGSNNDIVGTLPNDINAFLLNLKKIATYQKNQQQIRTQQFQQQPGIGNQIQMQQDGMMNSSNQDLRHLLAQNPNQNQNNNNWIPQQQQQQQQQQIQSNQTMYMNNQGQNQQNQQMGYNMDIYQN